MPPSKPRCGESEEVSFLSIKFFYECDDCGKRFFVEEEDLSSKVAAGTLVTVAKEVLSDGVENGMSFSPTAYLDEKVLCSTCCVGKYADVTDEPPSSERKPS
jgi:hypothetical protein